MSRKSLSDNGVANLKPRATRYTYPDPEMRGHYVRVSPSGAKSFAVVARDPAGKQVWAALGTVDVLRIDEARNRARRALQRIRDGLSPFEEAPRKPTTFQEVAGSWLKRHVEAKGLRSKDEIERCLKVYVAPEWRNRAFTGVKRGDITGLLDKIEDSHGPRQADVVLGILRGMANWYAARHDDYASPIVKGMRRQPQTRRDRILSDDEIRAIWTLAGRAGSFGAIIKISMLTAQRREKIATMRWADLAGDVWTIPVSAREKGAGGTLKLPPTALAVLYERPRMAGSPFVFAGRGDNAFNGFSKAKKAFDKALPKIGGEAIPGWTLHDLRRTSRSFMSRAGVRPDIAERVLGHVIAGVEGVYDRHRYHDEKASALASLAALLEGILAINDENIFDIADIASDA